jgi:glycine oxidase
LRRLGVDNSRGLDQRLRRYQGVGGVADSPNDSDPPGAGGEDRCRVRDVDPSDRKERHRGVCRRVGHELESNRCVTGLRWRCPDRTDADVVDPVGGVDLRLAVGREADKALVPDDRARSTHRHVGLADVNAVGIDSGRERGVVVDDEQRPRLVAVGGDCPRTLMGRRPRTELNDIDTTRERATEHALDRRAVTDQVQTCVGEPFAASHRLKVCQHGETMDRHDVIVIGGGVIGCSIAWRAAEHGLRVLLLERDRIGHGSTHAAAGMLAPVAEADFGSAGRALLDLGIASLAMWPGFAQELAQASATQSRLRTDGTMILARDRDAAEALERELAYRLELGLDVSRCAPSRARALEPALAPTVRLALEIPSESTVDPRWVCEALAAAARRAGAQLREQCSVAELSRSGGQVSGVVLDDGERLAGEHVVLAAGAWSGQLAAVPVRPVKGQIMRLRDPAGPGLVTHTLRFEHGYLVARGDGGYVLGASVEERGFDLQVTARPMYELLRDASELVPGLLELELEEFTVGLRPGSPDNLPLIGLAHEEGLIMACGHHRNGILLAPITAALVLDAIDGGAPARGVSPARYGEQAAFA